MPAFRAASSLEAHETADLVAKVGESFVVGLLPILSFRLIRIIIISNGDIMMRVSGASKYEVEPGV